MGSTECRSNDIRVATTALTDNTELGYQTHSVLFSSIKSHKYSSIESHPNTYTKPHFNAELYVRLDRVTAI